MNMMISLFDKPFEEQAYRLFKSFRHFHPNIPMYYGVVPPSDELNHGMLQSVGAQFLEKTGEITVKHKNVCDLCLKEYIQDLPWTKMMWVDADTLILGNLNHLFETDDYDFIGHPGRNKGGLIWKRGDLTYFALGMYVTSSKRFIDELYDIAKQNPRILTESETCTRMINKKFTFVQLNGNLYNFSRDIVPLAEYDVEKKQIFYRLGQLIYYPYTVGFSGLDNGQKPFSPAIEKFYEEVICGSAI